MVREENLKNSAKKTPLIREDLYLVAAVYNTINGMKCVPFCRKKAKRRILRRKRACIYLLHCFHHVEQEDEFHPFIVNTVKHFTECSKMLSFLLSKESLTFTPFKRLKSTPFTINRNSCHTFISKKGRNSKILCKT